MSAWTTALGSSVVGQVVSVGLSIATVAYLGACRVLGVRELGSLCSSCGVAAELYCR